MNELTHSQMSDDEMIDTLKGLVFGTFDRTTSKEREALDLAIKKLSTEPCEDCISREATVKRLCKVAEFMNEKRDNLGAPYIMAALFIQDNKEVFPSVQPIRPKGEWEHWKGEKFFDVPVCSNCGMTFSINARGWSFCPNCGDDKRKEK